MFNMASVRIVFLCLFISSLMHDALSAQKKLEVKCSKSKIEALFGTTTLLDCVAHNQSDIFGINWQLDDVKILSSGDDKFDPVFRFHLAKSARDQTTMNVSLLITNTNLSHTGEYKCTVVTADGVEIAHVHVTVKAPYSKPVILSDPDKISSDKDFTLTCQSHSGFPQGHIRWVVNDAEWTQKPKDKVHKTADGLYNLSSSLSFGPHSVFTKFVCEVYNASKVMEGQKTFEIHPMEQSIGSDTKERSLSPIVTPVVVIGSLIVGLLIVLVLRRRKHRNVPMDEYPEENVPMDEYPEENNRNV